MKQEVVLTPQEFEDLKDDIKFKTTVILQLKQLVGIPKQVDKLAVHSGIHWGLIILMLSSIVGLAFFVLREGV